MGPRTYTLESSIRLGHQVRSMACASAATVRGFPLLDGLCLVADGTVIGDGEAAPTGVPVAAAGFSRGVARAVTGGSGAELASKCQ